MCHRRLCFVCICMSNNCVLVYLCWTRPDWRSLLPLSLHSPTMVFRGSWCLRSSGWCGLFSWYPIVLCMVHPFKTFGPSRVFPYTALLDSLRTTVIFKNPLPELHGALRVFYSRVPDSGTSLNHAASNVSNPKAELSDPVGIAPSCLTIPLLDAHFPPLLLLLLLILPSFISQPRLESTQTLSISYVLSAPASWAIDGHPDIWLVLIYSPF